MLFVGILKFNWDLFKIKYLINKYLKKIQLFVNENKINPNDKLFVKSIYLFWSVEGHIPRLI